MKLKSIALLASIIGITILYLISMATKPPLIDLEDISEYNGKQIITTGIVSDYYTTSYGSQIITIQSSNASAKVFIEGEVDVEFGDKIQVTGEVQKYKNEWEIIVDSTLDLIILEKWNNISSPIWQLSQNPTKYLNTNVNTTGTIDEIYDSYFYLIDLENKYSLMVSYSNISKSSLQTGKKVTANGVFQFDEKNLRYYLKLHKEGGVIC